MKKILKNKKIIIPVILIIVILVVLGAYFLLSNNNENKESKVKKEGTFVAYVKINPLVKFTFHSVYYECTENNKTETCGEYTTTIEDVELLNDDAKETYKDVDFKGKSLAKGINMLISTAYENKINLKSISVYTDWYYKLDELKNDVKNNLSSEIDVNLVFTYKDELDETEIIENNTTKTYNITFDTDGGSSIEDQKVKENEVVTKPSDPQKDGYTFAGWTLNEKAFDFSTKVTSDLTLKAEWNKKESTSTNQSSSGNSSSSNTSNSEAKTNTTESSNQTTESTDNTNTLGQNEYYALKDGQVHKYSLVYSTLSECEKSAQGENLGDDFPFGEKIYQILQCDEIKDANGTHYWGMYFIDSISNQTGFYW